MELSEAKGIRTVRRQAHPLAAQRREIARIVSNENEVT